MWGRKIQAVPSARISRWVAVMSAGQFYPRELVVSCPDEKNQESGSSGSVTLCDRLDLFHGLEGPDAGQDLLNDPSLGRVMSFKHPRWQLMTLSGYIECWQHLLFLQTA